MPHPLHQFVYCPACGACSFDVCNEKSKKCATCGFIYYFNPSASAACFITDAQGNLLLIRRAKDPAKGTLDLPGGFADMYETIEETVCREVKEEIGLTVAGCRYLFSVPNIYLYAGFEVHTLDMFFECRVETFDAAKAADDAAEIVILSPEEVDANDFGLLSVRKAVKKYLS